jgi:hypothetical protein
MISANLQQWIQHPETLNKDTLYELRTLVTRYPYFQSLRTHIVTLQALWYAPPVTVHQIYKWLPLNGCGRSALRSEFAGQYGFAGAL